MIELINRYGIKIVKKGKDCCDFPELNKKIINKILLEGRSQRSVSASQTLPNRSMVTMVSIIHEKRVYNIGRRKRATKIPRRQVRNLIARKQETIKEELQKVSDKTQIILIITTINELR